MKEERMKERKKERKKEAVRDRESDLRRTAPGRGGSCNSRRRILDVSPRFSFFKIIFHKHKQETKSSVLFVNLQKWKHTNIHAHVRTYTHMHIYKHTLIPNNKKKNTHKKRNENSIT